MVSRSHGLLTRLRFRERVHKGSKVFAIGRCEIHFESTSQAALQPGLPAGAPVMKISTAPCQLAGWIHHHTALATDDPHELALGQYRAASDAGALGNVLHALKSLLGHLRDKTSPVRAWRQRRVRV